MKTIAEEIVFWTKVAVGVLVCWLALNIYDRVGELVWQFKSQPVSGYGSDGTSEAVWLALREVIQALAAIGSAVLIVLWATITAWIKTWRKGNDLQPDLHRETERKIRDALRRLRPRR